MTRAFQIGELKVGDRVVCLVDVGGDDDNLPSRTMAPGVLSGLGNEDFPDFPYRVVFDDAALNRCTALNPEGGTWCHKVAPAEDDAPPVVTPRPLRVPPTTKGPSL